MANKYELKNSSEEKGSIRLQFELSESDPFSKLPKEMEFSLPKKMLSGLMEGNKSPKPVESKKEADQKSNGSKKDSESKTKKD